MASIAGQWERAWAAPTGIISWVSTVDHKLIGRRYLFTAFMFFVLAGFNAMLMRTQLAVPQNTFLGAEGYNQLFTMHGTTMIFLVSTPILFGFGNALIPLMLGARDMAFPRLNAFGYWVFLFAGLMMWTSEITAQMPDAGWFNYVPLSGPKASPGPNIDYYVIGLTFLAFATTAGSINFIVTAFKMRAPGMTVSRIPIFVWAIVVTSFMVIFALPALTADNILLYLDRHFDTHFFDPAGGGNPLLWQHLFWIFGHPDVYIIFLPAVGIVSTIVPVFCQHRLVGHSLVVLATVATGILSFGVWVHHMFAVGLPDLSNSFFAAVTALIAIPSGIQVVAWLATIWNGQVQWKSPFLFIFGFFALFLIGGVTGVMFSVVPFDRQVTDTYFVVAHFHYVLFGGAIFPVFAGLHYWWPKLTGRMLSEPIAVYTFWTMFIGFNITFFPMHILGFMGMPRRNYTYLDGRGWDFLNLLETLGAFVVAFSVLLFIWNAVTSLRSGERAGDNPWHASTLEWATSSPPPVYNFRTIPTVYSTDPLWDEEVPVARAVASHRLHGDLTLGHGPETVGSPTLVTEDVPIARDAAGNDLHGGLTLRHGRETVGSSILDAEPERVLAVPKESIWPLVVAIGLLLLFSSLFAEVWWLLAIGAVVAIAGGIAWTWPGDTFALAEEATE